MTVATLVSVSRLYTRFPIVTSEMVSAPAAIATNSSIVAVNSFSVFINLKLRDCLIEFLYVFGTANISKKTHTNKIRAIFFDVFAAFKAKNNQNERFPYV